MNINLAAVSAVLLDRACQSNAFAYVDQPDGGIPPISRNVDNRRLPSSPVPSPRTHNTPPSFPDQQTLQSHAQFASTLADAARAEIQPYWRASRHALGQQIKLEDDRSVFQSASPVTLADRAAERAMRELIEENFPGHGIYGEEFGVKDADADWVW